MTVTKSCMAVWADHWNVPVYHYDPTGKYDSRLAYIADPPAFGNNEISWREADHINSGVHSSEMLCDAAIRFLENHDQSKPILHVHSTIGST